MTKKELVEALKDYPDDFQVKIHAFGGLRGFSPTIKRVSNGIDWDANSVILHGSTQLWVHPPKKKE